MKWIKTYKTFSYNNYRFMTDKSLTLLDFFLSKKGEKIEKGEVISPISLAETEEQIYELNRYTNFQPLCAYDNLSKGNKWTD